MNKREVAVMVLATIPCVATFAGVPQAADRPARAAAAQAAPDQNVIHDPAEVPAGTYAVDPQHASLTGTIRHAGLTHFFFRFDRFSARFTYDPAKLESPSIDVTIDPSSIDTNVAGFDTNLATSDRHFNVQKFPVITFVSNSLKRTSADKGVMTGNITFLGRTEPLDFDVTFLGVTKARGGATVGLMATTTIKRSDFGFAEGSADLADEVAVNVDANFVQQLPPR